MQEKLKQFMVRLATDVDLLTRFIDDAPGTARAEGLADDDVDILLCSDQSRIYLNIVENPPVPPPVPAAPQEPYTFDDDLIVVGSGIRTIGQMTTEAIAWIRRADKVLHIVSDPIAMEVFAALNPSSESLQPFYQENVDRIYTYQRMADEVMNHVRAGEQVCFIAYGHPGVFAWPTHEAVRRARSEGYKARMLPGVSAEDCLFADIGIDPAAAGCQSFEATDFLVNFRVVDISAHLILWQIGALGDPNWSPQGFHVKGLPQLVQKLCNLGYNPYHPVWIYEAPIFPGVTPYMQPVALWSLPYVLIRPSSTLYIPPANRPAPDYATAWSVGMLRT